MSEFPALDAISAPKPQKRQADDNKRGLPTDIPLQVVGGVRDAVDEVLDTIGIGKYSTIYAPTKGGPSALPEVPEADTVTGSLTRGAAQFTTGFIPAFKALNAGKSVVKVAQFAKSLGLSSRVAQAIGIGVTSEGAAMLADQVVFDPYEGRLSNLIQSVPALENPVTEYLTAKPGDSEAEARFKVALEGAGIGLMVAPLVPVFRHMRANKAEKNLDKAFELAKKAEEANISKATKETAEKTSAEDILADAPQGSRPFVNNKYLDTPDDIKNTLNAVTSVFEKTIDKARRGRMAVSQTEDLARQMNMSVSDLTKNRLNFAGKRGRGTAFNAEEALAARMLLNKVGDNLMRLSRAAADPEQNTDAVQFAFQKALARHAAVQEQVMGITAEAGRALRQFQIPAGMPDRNKAIRQLLEEQGHNVDPKKLADMVAKLDTPEGLAAFARQIHKPTWSDRIIEAWINSLLSGPTTQAVNISSNTLVATWTVPETALAAVLGSVRKNDKVYFREIPARVFGMAQGAKDGIRLAAKTFITEEPSDLLTKIETSRFQSIDSFTLRPGAEKKVFGGVPIPFTGEIKLGGKQVRIPGRLLQAGDEFFKSIGYRMELNAQAMRSGLKQGLSGDKLTRHIKDVIENPPRQIHLDAIEAARYQTFTNELGKGGQAIQTIAAHHPSMRVVMPFIRTPVNIVKFAGARSPLGFAMDSVKQQLKAGGAVADIAKARIYMGSAVGVGVATLALEGTITGGGPGDTKQRAALFNAGWQPYSIRIGDKYYAYSRLEPLGMLLGISADMAEIRQAMSDPEADDIAGMIVGSIAKNLTSKTWLRGLSEIILAIEDPDRYGDNYIRKVSGTVVPTGLAQIAKLQDPVMRQASTVLDQIKSRMPGQSQDLFPIRNVWGEPIEYEGALGPNLLSPVYVSTISNDPVAREIARLELGLSKPDRFIRGIELTDAQYDKYVQESGAIGKRIVMNYVTSPVWDRFPDFKKKEMIKKAMTKARAAASVRMRVETTPELVKKKQKEIEEMISAFEQ